MLDRLCFNKEALFLQILDDGFSRLVAVHALIFSRVFIHDGVVVEHADYGQAMAKANLEVVRVVRRRNLNNARTKVPLNVCVRDNRDFPAYKRQDKRLPDHILIAFVVGMDGDRRVPEQRLRPGCRKLYISGTS